MMVIGLRGPFGTAHDHPDVRKGVVVIDAQHQGFPLPRRQGPDRLPQTVLQLGSGDLRKGIVRGRKRQPFHILMMRQAGTIAQRVTALVEADLIDPGPKAGLALEGPMMEEDLHERLLRHVGRVSMVLQHSERRSEEHTSELQSRLHLVCRLLLEKKKTKRTTNASVTLSARDN